MRLSRSRRLLAVTAATSALLMTAACGSDGSEGGDAAAPAATATAGATDETADSAPSEGGSYADGTYEAQGTYTNPGGLSTVTVSLTLEGDTIADVEVTPEASGTSRQFQDKFVSGIADEVTGKKLDEISVDKVSGSSLTSGGFNDALEKIKTDAAS